MGRGRRRRGVGDDDVGERVKDDDEEEEDGDVSVVASTTARSDAGTATIQTTQTSTSANASTSSTSEAAARVGPIVLSREERRSSSSSSSASSSASASSWFVRTERVTMNNGSERTVTIDERFEKTCMKCARGSSCYATHRATSAIAGMRTRRGRRAASRGRNGRRRGGKGGGESRDESSADARDPDSDPLAALERLIADGHRPTRKTFTAVITALGALGRIGEFDRVMDMIGDYGDAADVATWNAVAHALCALGNPSGAEEIVDKMCSEEIGVGVNDATHPEIIYTYAKRGESNRVYRVIRRMSSEHGILPDEKAYNAFLRGLCEIEAAEEAEEVLRRWHNEKFDLERQSERGGRVSKPTAASYGLVIDCWVRIGNMLAARKLLQQMQWERVAPSLPIFNMLIDGYLKQANMGAAEGIFRELESSGTWDMDSLGIKPDKVTYTLFLDYWANQGQADTCERIFAKMIKFKIVPDVIAFGALVKAYARSRDTDKAEEVLDRLEEAEVEPSVEIYSAVIAAHCTVGDMERARAIFDRMLHVGLRPNERTFAHFAWGYGQIEDINGITEVARLMVSNGMKLKGSNRQAIVRACQECGMRINAVEALLDRISAPDGPQRKGVWSRDPSASNTKASTTQSTTDASERSSSKPRNQGDDEDASSWARDVVAADDRRRVPRVSTAAYPSSSSHHGRSHLAFRRRLSRAPSTSQSLLFRFAAI